MKPSIASPTVEAYAELQLAFDHFNRQLFDGSLPFCLITMQREKHTYGYFSSRRFVHRVGKQTTDEIAMNPAYFAVSPVLEVLQTLVHEMAHLWQFHQGRPGRRGYHNREWGEKMEAIGLMPSSTGRPGGAKTGEKMADYPIEGGRFLEASEELLAGDFRISWLDRFPYPRPVIALPSPLETPDWEIDEDAPLAPAIVEILPGGRGTFSAEVGALAADLGALLEPIGQRNRSNRVKYRCPCCGTQVWGKPALRILCGEESCDAAEFYPVG